MLESGIQEPEDEVVDDVIEKEPSDITPEEGFRCCCFYEQ